MILGYWGGAPFIDVYGDLPYSVEEVCIQNVLCPYPVVGKSSFDECHTTSVRHLLSGFFQLKKTVSIMSESKAVTMTNHCRECGMNTRKSLHPKTKADRNVSDYLRRPVGPLTFGMFLRAARAALGLSQVEMAKELGISRGTLCDIEKSRQLVSPALAVKIAKKAGLSKALAVKACLQDQLDKANIKMTVELSA